MKHFIIISTLAAISFGAIAQEKGIKFLNDTVFENVLAKAKAEDKLIFLDCYAVWCGPCKMMDANIFPDEQLGEFHNTHFINIKYDMEKPYGMEIRSKYGVRAYPTFLYLNGDGEVVHRMVGGTAKPEDFLKYSKLALDTENNFMAVNNRIENGDRSAATIDNYLKMSYGATNADQLIEEHFMQLDKENKIREETWNLIKSHLTSTKSPAFIHFTTNKKEYASLYGNKAVDDYVLKVLSATQRKSNEEYEALQELFPELFVRHQLERTFMDAYRAFFQDQTNKAAWENLIISADAYHKKGAPQPGLTNSIVRIVMTNYENFNDKASLSKALEWIQVAISSYPEIESLPTTRDEVLKLIN
jgi:thiol-disulfide isomerase/thioredoxin